MNVETESVERMLELAITIQQIPAPTFAEAQRAAFVRERFVDEGLKEVTIDSVGNVYGCLRGEGFFPPTVISAHLDTVFPESIDLSLNLRDDQLIGPGIGDNSVGVAGLFGLLWELRQRGRTLPGDIWLVANVGEEGLGDLCGMRAVVDRFGKQVGAYIVLEGMALGQIYHRGLGVKRYRIFVKTAGGHSWVDFGRPSAVHELAAVVGELNAFELPVEPRTTLNVGVIAGGTTVNTIADQAYLELDLRSEDAQVLDRLSSQVENLVLNGNKPGVKCEYEVIGQRPSGYISPDEPLVRLAARSLENLGFEPRLNIGSTDANIPLSLGLPAICLGLTTGGGAHTRDEYIHISPLTHGLAQLVALVESINHRDA